MPNILFDLTWYRDLTQTKAFALLPPVNPQPRKRLTRPETVRESVEQSLAGEPDTGERPERIERVGGKLTPYRPLEEFPKLYCDFANIETAGSLYDFIRAFGMLTCTKPDIGAYDSTAFLLGHAKRMKAMLETKLPIQDYSLHRSVEVVLVADHKTQGLALRFRPLSLLNGLWLQFSQQHEVAAAEVEKCDFCAKLFPVGPGTGRRRGARYCTDDHKKQFNRRKALGK